MAVYPNNYSSATGWNTYRYFGRDAFYAYSNKSGQKQNFFLNENVEQHTSIPDGYAMTAIVNPIKAGGVSSFRQSKIVFSQSGALLSGGPVTGSATITFDCDDKTLNLLIFMTGTSTITFDADSCLLKLTMGLSGTGNIAFDADGNVLGLIIPIFGSATVTFTASADLRGNLSLSGNISPFTELSPENLASAVWNALGTSYNIVGSMGMILKSAGSAGDPWITELPGSYVAGSAGYIMGEQLTKLKNPQLVVGGKII